MKTIADFKSSLAKHGLARNNIFDVEIAMPVGLKIPQEFKIDTNELNLRCQSASFPSLDLNSKSFSIYKDTFEFATSKLYGALKLSFILDEKFKLRDFFEQWQALAFNPRTRNVGFYDQYTSNLNLKCYSREGGAPVYAIEFFEAFPKQVSEVALGQEAVSLVKIDVEFKYRRFERKDGIPVSTQKNPEAVTVTEKTTTTTTTTNNYVSREAENKEGVVLASLEGAFRTMDYTPLE